MSFTREFLIEKASFYRNPNIGVYIFVNNEIAIVPPGTEADLKNLLRDVLKVKKIIETKISDTNLVGVMIGGNDKGILLPRTIKDEEYQLIKREFSGNIKILETSANAIGNIILANSRAALVYKEADAEVIRTVKDILEVEIVERATIAGIPTIGSLGVITNRGGIVHPDASRKDLDFLRELFKVPIDVGTVNFGVPYVRSGLVANDKGALVGINTTGPEILRISKILGLGSG
ncbi:MAG: translation initiation factor IF-6 [Sulfolobales archaeon]|jgi:translation initiation factor 6